MGKSVAGPLSKEPPNKLGGIQDLEIQFELFGIMLMFDIATDHLGRDIVPYTADKITIVPPVLHPTIAASPQETPEKSCRAEILFSRCTTWAGL